MNTRYFALFAVVTFGLLSGCYADWNQFERGMNTSFVEDSRFNDLECDESGCYLCEYGTCTPYSCDTTNQCPQGYVCTIDQQCLPGVTAGMNPTDVEPTAGTCSDHSECSVEELCSLDGQCLPRLTSPEDASAEEASPTSDVEDDPTPATNEAIPLPEHPNDVCVVNSDCGAGICLNAQCFFTCATDGSCPTGQKCSEGQCMPMAADEHECTFNGECGPSRMCIEGLCQTLCQTDTECGSHEFCGEGLCEADTAPVIECSGPNSCDDGLSCVNGKCLNSCDQTDLCGANHSCEFGFCHQEVFCLEKSDCAAGMDCMDGRCQ